jgi:hypothetical protein
MENDAARVSGSFLKLSSVAYLMPWPMDIGVPFATGRMVLRTDRHDEAKRCFSQLLQFVYTEMKEILLKR